MSEEQAWKRLRTREAKGIYRDGYGLEAMLMVQGQRITKRFDPDRPLQDVKDWIKAERIRLESETPRQKQRGTLKQAIDEYCLRIQALSSWKETRAHLRAWLPICGDWPRWKIDAAVVQKAQGQWKTDGVAVKTINHRVAALHALYRTLDGDKARTPCDVPKLKAPTAPPQMISARAINAVLSRLTFPKWRARLMVLAASGARASEVMRAQITDVDFKAGVWRTRDGKGGYRPGGIPMTPDLRAAWKAFAAADAWGWYSTRDMAQALRKAGWPKGVRPYNLRHSVGMTLAEKGADLADISAFLGHARPLTTRSHYVPVTHGRMQKTATLLKGRFGW